MRNKIIALSAALLLSPVSAMAIDIQVCELYAGTDAKGYIVPCGTWTSPNSCTGGKIAWNITTDGAKAAYSTALVAYETGDTVDIGLTGSCYTSPDTFDTLSYIKLKK